MCNLLAHTHQLCCDFGNGKVTGTINGKTVVQSNDESFKRKDYYFNIAQAQTIGSPTTRPTQRITQRPTNNPTTRKPTPAPVQQLPTEPEVVVSFIMMGDGMLIVENILVMLFCFSCTGVSIQIN